MRCCQAISSATDFSATRNVSLRADEGLAGLEERRDDRPGKARGEGDVTLALGGEFGDEERSPAERARESGEEAAAGMRVHSHLIVHPGHRVGLAVNRFAGREIDRHRLHDIAADRVAHGVLSLLKSR